MNWILNSREGIETPNHYRGIMLMKFPKNQPELQEKKPGETKSHGWLGLQQEGGWSGTLADNFTYLPSEGLI